MIRLRIIRFLDVAWHVVRSIQQRKLANFPNFLSCIFLWRPIWKKSFASVISMKRDRAPNAFFDFTEATHVPTKRRVAETGEVSEFCEEEFEWPSSPILVRLRDSFSTHEYPSRPTAPLPIPHTPIQDPENYAEEASPLTTSWKIPMCCTPEELKSPHTRIPPSRPHKLSPASSTGSKMAHPQPSMKTIPLQGLMEKIRLRPGTNRLAGFHLPILVPTFRSKMKDICLFNHVHNILVIQ
jgi:hypothetical protein